MHEIMDNHLAMYSELIHNPEKAEKLHFPTIQCDKEFILWETHSKFRNVSFFNAAYKFQTDSETPESDSEEEEKAIHEQQEIMKRKSMFDKKAIIH